ncbi:helix-hairpin-helix domain-containing protein [Polluticaenibacter yanchengensis]|uniref:Helix-hairpin-helix domain-containing protein n=1 Tax=Polluticaenibacter yanchengensis TaxID=3014562 RepID=A0ABT4UFQ9_9BACT|nr:helix-hairpin-helix domain-containing protein [Chitinophagaceae bacterium LY-5]
MRWLHFFTKRERIGFIGVLSLLLVLLILIQVENKNYFNQAKFLSEEEMSIVKRKDSQAGNDYKASFKKNDMLQVVNKKLFSFDPNTITDEEWLQLGVSERTINTIRKYKEKGGKFYRSEDLLKIYNLDKALAAELLPYVNIKNNRYRNGYIDYSKNKDNRSKYKKDTSGRYKPNYTSAYTKKVFTQIYINSADTAILKQIPGIGSTLAKRIVSYRDRLGGFYAAGQLAEVFGLPDSTLQKMIPWIIIDQPVKSINLNAEDFKNIKHPYLNANLASVIYNYRMQHGNFKKVEDIKRIYILSDELFNKISPYLNIQ